MRCPGCTSDMERLVVNAVLGASAEVHACQQDRAFWFAPFETEHLTPQSTLQLVAMIAEHSKTPSTPWPKSCHCPMCASVLLLTHDMQRTTRFQYWRCDAGHGRFTAYVDFLREKSFIKALTPQERADISRKVQFIHCANCGGPIDLTTQSICPHCNAAISMIDMDKLSDLGRHVNAPPAPAAAPVVIFAQPPQPVSLVDFDLGRIASWFSGWLR